MEQFHLYVSLKKILFSMFFNKLSNFYSVFGNFFFFFSFIQPLTCFRTPGPIYNNMLEKFITEKKKCLKFFKNYKKKIIVLCFLTNCFNYYPNCAFPSTISNYKNLLKLIFKSKKKKKYQELKYLKHSALKESNDTIALILFGIEL